MQRTTIGLDIAKHVFQAHAVDPTSGEVTRTGTSRPRERGVRAKCLALINRCPASEPGHKPAA